MDVDGATWEACTPAWVHRHDACGAAIRQVAWDGSAEHQPEAIGHEHLMAGGCPVLWADALGGQRDRMQVDAGDARITGWGPDYTDVIVVCPVIDCPIEWRWEGDGVLTLAQLTDTVTRHFEERHHAGH